MKVMLARPKPHKNSLGLADLMTCEPIELEYVYTLVKSLGHQVIIEDMIAVHHATVGEAHRGVGEGGREHVPVIRHEAAGAVVQGDAGAHVLQADALQEEADVFIDEDLHVVAVGHVDGAGHVVEVDFAAVCGVVVGRNHRVEVGGIVDEDAVLRA